MSTRGDGAPVVRFIVYWRQADWGFYHRRNEALTRILATRDAVSTVVHLETVSLKGVVATLVRALKCRDPGLRKVYWLQVGKALSPSPLRVGDKLWVQSLLIVAFSNHPLVQRCNRYLFRRRATRLRSTDYTVLLAYPPAFGLSDLETSLEPELMLADMVDDVPALEVNPQRREARTKAFVDILPRCGAVFATSRQIAKHYGYHSPSGIEFLPNGVTVRPNAAVTRATAGERRPRVAYTGTLNQSLDTELVEHLLAHNAAVDFILIGPLETAAAAFLRRISRRYPNCHYLGKKRHEEMMNYLEGCDVLVNLKRADHTTQGNDSIKIYEYLATGLPVVSTSMAPADRMPELVYVADDPVLFHDRLQRALKENCPMRRRQRLEAAAENGWDRRVDRILERVGELTAPSSSPAKASAEPS